MNDKYSQMSRSELIKIIKKITSPINSGRGIPFRNYSYNNDYIWSEKIMRQFIRWCHLNLKEDYLAKIEIMEALENDNK